MKIRKINSEGIVHHLALILVVLTVTIVGTATLVASHAASAGIVITPGDWQTVTRASIVTDPPKGNVMKLHSFDSYSKPYNGGVVYTLSPHNKPLAKLHNFVIAHYGQPATICITARASQANSVLSYVSSGLGLNTGKYDSKTIYFGKSYDTKCINFTIISKSKAESNYSAGFPEWLEVSIGDKGYTGYLDNVNISLR